MCTSGGGRRNFVGQQDWPLRHLSGALPGATLISCKLSRASIAAFQRRTPTRAAGVGTGIEHDLEMSHAPVESSKGGSNLGFHDSALGVVTGKPVNCAHRIPKSQHLNLDRIICYAAQNQSTAKSPDMPERRQYAATKMREVRGRVIRQSSPSADDHSWAPEKIPRHQEVSISHTHRQQGRFGPLVPVPSLVHETPGRRGVMAVPDPVATESVGQGNVIPRLRRGKLMGSLGDVVDMTWLVTSGARYAGPIMILALKNLLVKLVVPGTVGVYLPLILAGSRTPASGLGFKLAILLFTIGGSIYAWCVFDLASFGRGTPLPLDAPRKLVRRGLYHYSRNPMYVGVLTNDLRLGGSLSKPSHCGIRSCGGALFLFLRCILRRAHPEQTFRH
jgi:protein-S-isoprenylcysteine O-methyltransferase Ste14